MNIARIALSTLIAVVVCSEALFITGCSNSPLPKGAVGNVGLYNYSPSVIETGSVRKIWWCSFGVSPSDGSHGADAIYYESINMSTHVSFGPILVLSETPGAWDSAYTCNPKVVGGLFHDPLGDGQDYQYAMYYVATANLGGIDNSIGVAFSNDGIDWKKYPAPIVPSTSKITYGVAQPVPYNADRKSTIYLFYEDTNPIQHHAEAVSTDGVHFSFQGALTFQGLDRDDPQPSWGDMAYDPKNEEWYALFNRPLRPPSTTGGIVERGQYGIELYKIPQQALLTGSQQWKQLVNLDTNATGLESNFIAGFVRDVYGNVNPASFPTIQIYTSVSYPPPNWNATPAEAGGSADPTNWILLPTEWAPSLDPTLPFSRYDNGVVHEVTTGWIPPDAGFRLQESLGHLYANPHDRSNLPLYSCKRGQQDFFVSLDIDCEGQRILGKNGYAYSQPVAGVRLVPVYRCSTGSDHFVSKDPRCEGSTTDGLLAYILP